MVKLINKKYEWAISDEARDYLKTLLDAGVDYDLAFTLLEKQLEETNAWCISKGSDDDE